MKNLLKISLILIVILTQSCDKDDCGINNESPTPFAIELIDKVTGENLFTNGTFKSEDIKFKDLTTEKYLYYHFIGESKNYIQIGPFLRDLKEMNYSLEINSTKIFELKNNDSDFECQCCKYWTWDEIEPTITEYKMKGVVIQILVDIS